MEEVKLLLLLMMNITMMLQLRMAFAVASDGRLNDGEATEKHGDFAAVEFSANFVQFSDC